MTRALRGAALAALLAAGLAAGCDDTFTPILPSEQRLSVWGYLNPDADTQWIRVGIMRSLLVPSADSLPVRVTLEDLGDGRVLQLRQATVRFPAVGEIDSAGLVAHNFWTSERIRPGTAYHLRAQPAQGELAEAVVHTPPDFGMEIWVAQRWFSTQDFLRVSPLKYIAFATMRSQFSDSCGMGLEERALTIPADTAGMLRSIPLSRTVFGRSSTCKTPTVGRRDIWIVGSGDPWPANQPFSVGGLGGKTPGNIANAVGFLGAAMERTIPYENCDYVTRTATNNYCPLRYDSTSASLRGIVSDPECGFKVPRATVRLLELDPVAPEVARSRSFLTQANGSYWIGALVPGMRYLLTAVRNEVREPGAIEYNTYSDTVRFQSGERADRDISLERSHFPCP